MHLLVDTPLFSMSSFFADNSSYYVLTSMKSLFYFKIIIKKLSKNRVFGRGKTWNTKTGKK